MDLMASGAAMLNSSAQGGAGNDLMASGAAMLNSRASQGATGRGYGGVGGVGVGGGEGETPMMLSMEASDGTKLVFQKAPNNGMLSSTKSRKETSNRDTAMSMMNSGSVNMHALMAGEAGGVRQEG